MIKAVIAINVAQDRFLFFISLVMMAHLGRNRVRGGSPPVDSRISEMMGRAIGILFPISDMEVIDVNEWAWKIKNIGIVIMI